MAHGLEVRVPFCDYRLVEYAYNIPANYKNYRGREKGLVRFAMEGVLPEDVLWRKKSPYPKTHNPNYMELLSKRLSDVLNSMRENKIEPKSITFVFNSVLDKPWLFLVTGKKGAKSGMIVEKPMILRNDDKSYTEEYTRLYD